MTELKNGISGRKVFLYLGLVLLSALSHGKDLPIVTYDFPPYNYVESGKIVGASTELVKHIFSEMGYNPNITSLPFKRALTFIEDGEVAVIYTYTHSPKRRKTVFLSNPVSYISGVFFKRRDDNITWNQYKDLAQLRVGASGGYYYPEPFTQAIKENAIRASFVYRKNPDLINLRLLVKGRNDVFICELNVCGFLIKKYAPEFNGIDYINKRTGSLRSFHVGFSKKWPEAQTLRDEFNVQLDKVLASGKLKKMFKKYGIITDFELLGSKALSSQ